MANKSINNLENAGSLANADLFVIWQDSTNTACNLSGQQFTAMLTAMADGHGGIDTIAKTSSAGTDPVVDTYTITYADDSTSTFDITNGVKGDTGAQTYVYVRYSDDNPTADADMSTVPAAWMGIYVGLESDPANLHYTDYAWYQIKGAKGDTGDSIDQIRLTGQSGLVDTYTVTTVGGINIGTFTVTNGEGGVSTVDGIAPDGNGNVQTIANSVTDLGLTVGSATLSGAYSALNDNQTLLCPATDFANAQLPYTYSSYVTSGVIEMTKTASGGYIEFHGIGSTANFIMRTDSSNVPTGTWVQTALAGNLSYYILGFQTVSCSSGSIAAGATGTATGTMTAVSGATGYWMWAYPNTIYGNPIGEPTRSGNTISVSVGNLSSGTHSILVRVCVIAYYKM